MMNDRLYFDDRAEIELSDEDRAVLQTKLEALPARYERVGIEAGYGLDMWAVCVREGRRWARIPAPLAALREWPSDDLVAIVVEMADEAMASLDKQLGGGNDH